MFSDSRGGRFQRLKRLLFAPSLLMRCLSASADGWFFRKHSMQSHRQQSQKHFSTYLFPLEAIFLINQAILYFCILLSRVSKCFIKLTGWDTWVVCSFLSIVFFNTFLLNILFDMGLCVNLKEWKIFLVNCQSIKYLSPSVEWEQLSLSIYKLLLMLP